MPLIAMRLGAALEWRAADPIQLRSSPLRTNEATASIRSSALLALQPRPPAAANGRNMPAPAPAVAPSRAS